MIKICLDAGHGGTDPGAIGDHGDLVLHEAEVNLAIVEKLGDILLTNGYEVAYTREADVYIPLLVRLKLISDTNSTAFVSVHCNSSSNPAANGTETLYRDDNDKLLATPIQASLVKAIETKDRGVRYDIGYLKKRLTVLSNVPVPSCLVEVAFISNEKDANKLLATGVIAQAIADGVMQWGTTRGEKCDTLPIV